MSAETQNSQRRTGPHAPLPTHAPAVDPEESQAPPASVGANEEDPRTRAARRALELRDHLGGMDQGTDKFYIDPRIIPDGWSYEYKTFEVLGKQNPAYQTSLAHRGWEPVPRSRHPQLMPENFPGDTILVEGMMLMERPKEITDEVIAADKKRARGQVRAKEEQLGAAPPGTFERDNKGNQMSSVKKSFESIPIPDK